jgi:hypothetical protein
MIPLTDSRGSYPRLVGQAQSAAIRRLQIHNKETFMTIATVREAIHERLDPVIEEIVTREISQRGGGYSYGRSQEEQGPFQALMPVLLSTILQGRQAGQQPQEILQNLLPVLPVLLQSMTRKPTGQQPQEILQNLLPILPAVLPLLLQQQRRFAGRQPQDIVQNILPILPALLPLIMQQQKRFAGLQPQEIVQNILPILPALLPLIMQLVPQAGQQQPQQSMQTLAPVLAAALTAARS